MPQITYVSPNSDGHHGEYRALFTTLFKELGLETECVTEPSQAQDGRTPLFYSMFDSKPRATFAALTTTLLRAARGRKTVGLLFRPETCLTANSWKYFIKKLLLRATSRLPPVFLLTIQPFTLCPEFATIATSGIYDPQLWDLHYLEMPTDNTPDLKRHIASAAQGRRLVVALGSQNHSKGFDCMVDLWCASPELRDAYLFAVAGKIGADSLSNAQRFERNGGFLLNKRIDNDELFGLYQMADIVWSCYAPQYDQASGIHGRAVQLGIPVVVREGSYLEKLGEMIGHPTLVLNFENPQSAADNLLSWHPSPVDEETRTKVVTKMREHSLVILAEAIGVVHPTLSCATSR